VVHRLEIALRPTLRDPRGAAIAATVREFLGVPVRSVRTRDVYRIEAPLTSAETARVLHEFVDPVAQHARSGDWTTARSTWRSRSPTSRA
jgi:phosphoribosylformylglycinamidine (FGAM) synthase PurS component